MVRPKPVPCRGYAPIPRYVNRHTLKTPMILPAVDRRDTSLAVFVVAPSVFHLPVLDERKPGFASTLVGIQLKPNACTDVPRAAPYLHVHGVHPMDPVILCGHACACGVVIQRVMAVA